MTEFKLKQHLTINTIQYINNVNCAEFRQTDGFLLLFLMFLLFSSVKTFCCTGWNIWSVESLKLVSFSLKLLFIFAISYARCSPGRHAAGVIFKVTMKNSQFLLILAPPLDKSQSGWSTGRRCLLKANLVKTSFFNHHYYYCFVLLCHNCFVCTIYCKCHIYS